MSVEFGGPIPFNAFRRGELLFEMEVADFNRDGKQDALINSAVWPGNGNGTFNLPTHNSFTPGILFFSSSVTDLNQDSNLDLVRLSDNRIHLWYGKRDCTFTDGGTLIPSSDADSSLNDSLTADFNNDGRIDIATVGYDFRDSVASSGYRIKIFLNQNGKFSRIETDAWFDRIDGPFFKTIQAADFDGDGNLDIAAGGLSPDDLNPHFRNIRIFLGNGDGSFRAGETLTYALGVLEFESPHPGFLYAPFHLADLNQDQKIDILTTDTGWPTPDGIPDPRTSAVRVFLGNGNGTFSSPWQIKLEARPIGTALGDLDGDGTLDLVVPGGGSKNTYIYRGRNDGTFALDKTIATDFYAVLVNVADFNGDAKPDLLISGSSRDIILTPLDQDDVSKVDSKAAVFLNGVTIDLNQALFQNSNGSLASWLLDKTTFLTATALTGNDLSWRALALNDFNGDNQSDLLFQRRDGRLAIGFLNGTSISSTQLFNFPNIVPSSWQFVGVADVNADSKKDLVWNTGAGITAWLLDGSRVVQQLSLQNGPLLAGSKLVGVADFNHDGSADLLWERNGVSTVHFLSRGQYRYLTYLNGGKAVASGWKVVALGDLNDDGSADILWQNSNGVLAVWPMNGTNRTSVALLRDGKPVSPGWRIVGVN